MQWFPRSRVLCWSRKLEDHCSAEGRQGGRSLSPARTVGQGMWWQLLCRVEREHPSTIKHCTEGESWEKASCFTDFHKKGIKSGKMRALIAA